MKRMLFNATQAEELRVALVDGQRLYDLDIETAQRESKKSNVYKGKITRVEPSLEAAFVDYGAERHGFLPLKEISRTYFREGAETGGGRVNIKDVLSEGQEVIVQIDKEERGTKGAALTTFASLAGRYLVLMPNNPRAGGVSRRIEGDERSEARDALSALTIPTDMGLIIRTAGVGKSVEELQWDLDYLLHLWASIEEAAQQRPAPFLIYQETNLVTRAIRDYLRSDINEILIDEPAVYEQAREFMSHVMPHNLHKVKLYEDPVPLFTRYQIESQLESAFQREVRLPSGGALVIDHTEALVCIDVNSAKATKGGDIEETALNTNVEAAEELARQLRLRDIGGLIVIDFIDMTPPRNQREVENRLRDALKLDRARVQIGRISRFGLLEMSRQRLRPSLGESSQVVCPRCDGQGTIRSIESLSLSVLRIIEEEAMKEKTGRVVAQLPVQAAAFLLNEKRDILSEIEQRQKVSIVLVPNTNLDTPHYEVQRLRADEMGADEAKRQSYELAATAEFQTEIIPQTAPAQPTEQPAVKAVPPATPRPAPTPPPERPKKGLFVRLWEALFGTGEPAPKKAAQRPTRGRQPQRGKPRQAPGAGRGRGQQQRRQPQQRRQEPQRAPKPERKKEPPRPEGRAKQPKPAEEPKAGQPAPETEQPRAEEQKPETKESRPGGSRRGRRGGRRRRGGGGGADKSASSESGPRSDDKAAAGPTATGEGAAPQSASPTSPPAAAAEPARQHTGARSEPAEPEGDRVSPAPQESQRSESTPASTAPAADTARSDESPAGSQPAPRPEALKPQPAAPAAATPAPTAPRQVETRQVETRQSEPRQLETRQVETRQHEQPMQGETRRPETPPQTAPDADAHGAAPAPKPKPVNQSEGASPDAEQRTEPHNVADSKDASSS
ncbi:MAG: ribonuclease E [Pseudomonadota bacterium]|nr:MAG: ribonuclease E [Pseudomonadota bacterium]